MKNSSGEFEESLLEDCLDQFLEASLDESGGIHRDFLRKSFDKYTMNFQKDSSEEPSVEFLKKPFVKKNL